MSVQVRARFEQQLAELNEQLLSLGGLARAAISEALRAYVTGDAGVAREIIAGDSQINDLRYEIEFLCHFLIATEQPVAGDLRTIVAALILSGELERIGDHGKKIAKTSLRASAESLPLDTTRVEQLGNMSLQLLDRALRAYGRVDVEEADSICRADDQVDAFYKYTFNEIIAAMIENPKLISAGTHQIQIAHELERVADRATNIAERIIYAVSGELFDRNT